MIWARTAVWWVRRVVRSPVTITNRWGVRIRLHPTDNLENFFLRRDRHDQAELSYCGRVVGDGDVVFDVGANIGRYTVLLSKRAIRGQVHAFEPEAKNFRRLEEHVALNRCTNVHLNQKAVYSVTTQLQLNIFDEAHGSWHSLAPREIDMGDYVVHPTRRDRVAAVALDDYCQAKGIERIDFLKIDVEGAEFEVLKGAANLLNTGRIGLIMFEVGDAIVDMGHSKSILADYLARYDYKVFTIAADGTEGDPVTRIEMIQYANLIARR